MNLFFATLGELIIIQICVMFIWIRVLFDTMRMRAGTVTSRKMLTTSLGLVFNAFGMIGVLSWRFFEYAIDNWPFVWGVTVFYAVLAAGGILFIITPALGGSLRAFRVFLGATAVWTFFCIYAAMTGLQFQ